MISRKKKCQILRTNVKLLGHVDVRITDVTRPLRIVIFEQVNVCIEIKDEERKSKEKRQTKDFQASQSSTEEQTGSFFLFDPAEQVEGVGGPRGRTQGVPETGLDPV